MNVFYCAIAAYNQIVDVVTADETGQFSKMTKEQLEAKYGGAVQVMSHEDAIVLIEAAATTKPVAIDEDRFVELLEVLPPSKWRTFAGAEAFHICERITYSIVTWCVRIGTQYFAFDGTCNMSSQEAVELVKNHLQSQLQPA